VIDLYWYGVGVTHKIVREPVINNHSEIISRTSLGFFDFIIIQYGAAVEIQQRGHSGKALEKKKYGG
jgi:hypothetical protein